MRLSRRVFIHRVAFLGGGAVLLEACNKGEQPTVDSGNPPAKGVALITSHRTFTDDEFKVMAAAVDRIVPKDEDVGALDANVPEYIDRMLQTPEMHQMKVDFVAGTAALNRRSVRMFQKPFYEATPDQRDELLRIFRDSKQGTGEENYYSLLVTLTLEGFLGDPSYGGNKDKVGWAFVGFEKVDSTKADPKPGYDGTSHLHHMHGGN